MTPPTAKPHSGASTVGSNREQVRQHNLSAILRLLRQFGTMSRSALTQRTGLNRSTISDLVTELQELGLIVESEASATQGVGRPSLMVSFSDEVVVFAVNPETDATTVGVVTLSGKVITKVRHPHSTVPSASVSVETTTKLIAELRTQLPVEFRIAGIGVAIPGQIRVEDGVVRLAPHLNWVEVPFARMLHQQTGLSVFIDNDASLGSIAERDLGAGRGFSEIVYLFGGAGGIGGGVIHGGLLLRGAAGYAGELGHVRISDSPREDYSGLQGTLESLVQRDDLLAALKISSADDAELEEVLSKPVTAKVQKLLESQIDALAIAIGNYVNIFNPEIVLLAGYLGVLYSYDRDRLLSRFRWSTLTAPQDRLLVKPAELGPNLLMIGAAGLPIAPLLAEPAITQLFPARGK
ncbi:putative NBD/HSP70 family sugar kinase [Aurantimicrobium minutum]|uniref:ROK family transcriptional regulator n=1 Tax=Aurantimicrobium minutum TaxID=708131 RepID=UPI002473C653|nr:ROK family transcriptional regulator [Aurantimicrobium minutum]MDH6277568.1 putative NBD/HSP70 family sugar kinase [Aurantimicrobium minutum]